MAAMLEISGVHTFYGHIEALRGIDMTVSEGEIVTLIGANGAGKSTLLMTICGTPRAREGSVRFEGQNITNLATFEIMRKGIAQSPEGRRIFPRMTVLENLQMGAVTGDPKNFAADLEKVMTLFPILKQRQAQRGGTLSGGEQQMLAIGRGLASAPDLLMLDEPSMGLAPAIVDAIFERIQQIHRNGLTILLVEQRVAEALETCDHGYVLETGRVSMEGTHKTLMSDERVRRAYLGM